MTSGVRQRDVCSLVGGLMLGAGSTCAMSSTAIVQHSGGPLALSGSIALAGGLAIYAAINNAFDRRESPLPATLAAAVGSLVAAVGSQHLFNFPGDASWVNEIPGLLVGAGLGALYVGTRLADSFARRHS